MTIRIAEKAGRAQVLEYKEGPHVTGNRSVPLSYKREAV